MGKVRVVHSPDLAYRVYRLVLSLRGYDEDVVRELPNEVLRSELGYLNWLKRYVKPLAESAGIELDMRWYRG